MPETGVEKCFARVSLLIVLFVELFLLCNSKGDDGEGTAGPKFGHLHVVFRDWNYSGTAEDVSI